MARTSDAPGTFRIKEEGSGRVRVSGVTKDGERVKFTKSSRADAEEAARSLFGDALPTGIKTPETPPVKSQSSDLMDEWGLPMGLRVSPETVAQLAPPVAASTAGGAPQASAVTPSIADTAKQQEKKEKNLKRAKSLAEMFGVGWAAGVGFMSRKAMEESRTEIHPNKRNMNELADSFKDAMTESFGDREVGPWTMVLILSIGIPISMWLQSRKLTKEELEARVKEKERRLQVARHLSSV